MEERVSLGLELHRLCERSSQGRHLACPSIRRPKLILPVATPGRTAGLRFFLPSALSRIKFQVRSIGSLPAKVRLAGRLSSALGLDSGAMDFIALSIGTPGPYQKITILHADSEWRPLFVSKLGLTPTARALLANEAITLEKLASIETLAGFVPVLLTKHEAQGAFCMRQSLAIGQQWGALNASQQIIGLLRSLGVATEVTCELGEANIYRLLKERMEHLMGKISPSWAERLVRASSWLSARVNLKGRFVRAHRDFVYWNIKSVGGKPFIYDWEYSEEGYPDAYDAIHFMLMPKVSRGAVTEGVIASAKVIAKRVVDGRVSELDISTQLVLYALDVATFYLASNDGADDGDRVVLVLGELIDRECVEVVP